MKATVRAIKARPGSIYDVLARKLGREPSRSELRAEMNRIFREAKSRRKSP